MSLIRSQKREKTPRNSIHQSWLSKVVKTRKSIQKEHLNSMRESQVKTNNSCSMRIYGMISFMNLRSLEFFRKSMIGWSKDSKWSQNLLDKRNILNSLIVNKSIKSFLSLKGNRKIQIIRSEWWIWYFVHIILMFFSLK